MTWIAYQEDGQGGDDSPDNNAQWSNCLPHEETGSSPVQQSTLTSCHILPSVNVGKDPNA